MANARPNPRGSLGLQACLPVGYTAALGIAPINTVQSIAAVCKVASRFRHANPTGLPACLSPAEAVEGERTSPCPGPRLKRVRIQFCTRLSLRHTTTVSFPLQAPQPDALRYWLFTVRKERCSYSSEDGGETHHRSKCWEASSTAIQ